MIPAALSYVQFAEKDQNSAIVVQSFFIAIKIVIAIKKGGLKKDQIKRKNLLLNGL